jgi:hypothetical protein
MVALSVNLNFNGVLSHGFDAKLTNELPWQALGF